MLLQQIALWYPQHLSYFKVLAWFSLFFSPFYSFSILEVHCWSCSTMSWLIFSLKCFLPLSQFPVTQILFPFRTPSSVCSVLFSSFLSPLWVTVHLYDICTIQILNSVYGSALTLWMSCSLPLILASFFLPVSSHSHSTFISGWGNSRKDQPWAPVVKPLQVSCQFHAGTVPFGGGCA